MIAAVRRHGLLFGLVALVAASGAGAQDTALPSIEVIATGAALPTELDALPSSTTRVERDTLAEAQYQVNLSEALARVPGLVANNRQNYAQDLQISIRGFGARAAFGVRGLRLYTDGIPATMPDGQGQVSHFDLLGAERITVLRGPFSALYGSASGGVIELTTRDPAAPFVEATGWGGADALQRYGLVVGSAGADWSALGAASWFDTAGHRAHSAATRVGGQARLAAGDAVLIANAVNLEAQDPLGLTRAQWEQDPHQAGSNAAAYDTRKTVQQSQAGLAWTRPLGPRQAVRFVGWAGQRDTRQYQSIPDTVQGTLAGNPTHPGGVIDLDRVYYGADLRWLARAGPAPRAFNFALGADLEFLDERRQGFQNFTGTPGPGSTKGVAGERRRDEDNRAASTDPYAQADWRFAADWLALLGARYASSRFRSDDRFVVAGNGDDSGAVSYHAWLPVAGLRYVPGPLALHAAVSRGSETPTLNELAYRPDGSAGLNTDLRAARSSNYEVGASYGVGRHSNAEGNPHADERRQRVADLRLELAVFHIDTTDEIVVAGSSGGRTTFRNAAATARDGAEASLHWQIAGFAPTLAYTYLDARYDASFAMGARLPGVPRHTLFGELTRRHAALSVALEGLYRSAVSVNDAGTDAASGYTVVNLRGALNLPAGVQLFARVDNLLDRRYAGSVIVNETNARYFEPAPGRTLGAGLRWSFGR